MSAFQIFTLPSQQALDSSARVRAGAKLYFYLTGTSTPADAYADSGLTTPIANPLKADSGGVFAQFFLDPDVTYRIVMKDAAGAVIGGPWDPANEKVLTAGSVGALVTREYIGATLYPRTAAEVAASVTPLDDASFPPIGVDVRRFGVVGDGVTDDSAAMATAISTAQPLDLGNLTIRITTKLTFNKTNQHIYARGGGFKFDGASTQRVADVSATGVEFHGVDFNGNNKQLKGCLVYVATDAQKAKFVKCRFRAVTGTHVGGLTNVDSNNQYGLVISFYGVQGFEVDGCLFDDISNDNSGANGVAPAQGIAFTGGILFCTDYFATPVTPQTIPTSGRIHGCLFNNIRTVLANGLSAGDQQIFGDADGVRFFGERAIAKIKLPVVVQSCTFYNVAKRAVKNSEASGTTVRDITVIATTALQYPMLSAVKVDGDNQIVDGVNIDAPSTAPMRIAIQSHNCTYLRVENVEVNFCDQLWDLAPTDVAYVTRGWRVKNLQASSCTFFGIRNSTTCDSYIDCHFEGIEVVAAAGVHNFIGFRVGAQTDRVEITLQGSRIEGGEVKINGYGWTLRGVYQEINDAAFVGSAAGIALLEAGLNPGTAVTRRSVIDGYDLNVKALPNAYLSGSRPYLFLLYGDRHSISGLRLTVPETLTTSQAHGAFDGSDQSIVGFEYSGQSNISVGTVFTATTKSRVTIDSARRIGGTTAANEFLRIDKCSDTSLCDIADYRDSASGTINLVGGTVSAGKTFAYIIQGVRTRSAAANPVTTGATISQADVVKF